MLHIRFRTGKANTQRGVIRFVDELVARVRAAGATGQILLRADSGFHNKALRARLAAKGVLCSIGVRVTNRVEAQISKIAQDAWQTLPDYPATGEAQIAESVLDGERLIVRRVRPLGKDAQGKLFETWQHHALISNRTDALHLVEAEHRAHAVVELAIRDVKDQALAHFPSGDYDANAAWTVIACLAHDLLRWTELLGLPASTPRRARTHRRRLLELPGRLTRHARAVTLHLPARWPWQTDYIAALTPHPSAASAHLTPAAHGAHPTDDQRADPPAPRRQTPAPRSRRTTPSRRARRRRGPPATRHRPHCAPPITSQPKNRRELQKRWLRLNGNPV